MSGNIDGNQNRKANEDTNIKDSRQDSEIQDAKIENTKIENARDGDIKIEDAKIEDEDIRTEDQRLEDVLALVEHCIVQLDDPQISLEDSFRFYEEGLKYLKICSAKVEQIEKKMLVLNQQGELEYFNR